MNVIELYELADWYNAYFKNIRDNYNALHAALSNNATQQAQQPVGEHLQNLIDFLSEMHMGQLSLEQQRMLEKLEVDNLLGFKGVNYVQATVKTTSYDPATTEQKIGSAIQKLNSARERLSAYSTAVKNIGIEPDVFEDDDDRIVIRIGFRNEAAINNIVDWKKSSEDWHHIIRGLAIVAGETPEDTKVIGATKGSLILIIAATCTVTKLLAMISKHITSIAKDVITVALSIEDLRQKKLLNKIIENDLDKQKQKIKEDGIKAIKKELVGMMPSPAAGDAAAALEKSIDKLLEFGEHGGDVDFVSPPEEDIQEGEEGDDNAPKAAITEFKKVRDLIRDYQEEREAVKLLENNSPK